MVPTIAKPGADVLNPRTAVAYNDTHVFFVVVDGRSSRSAGMNMAQLGSFCRDELKARWGVNLDGGGSTPMWVKGKVKNVPSDGIERPVANAVFMVNVPVAGAADAGGAADAVLQDAAAVESGPVPGRDAAAPTPRGSNTGSGGCSASGSEQGPVALPLLVLVGLLLRRRLPHHAATASRSAARGQKTCRSMAATSSGRACSTSGVKHSPKE